MRTVLLAFTACMLAGSAWSASRTGKEAAEPSALPGVIYQRDLTCAATMAALASRLPPTSTGKTKQDAREGVVREHAFAVDAGRSLGVPEPEVDRLIAQKRDAILARAGKSTDSAGTNRMLFIDTVSCEVDQLGDAIRKAKKDRAARPAKP